MRWTKGKPASEAPCDVPLLARYEHPGRPWRYAVVICTAGPWQCYGGGEPVRSFQWCYLPGGAMADAPTRIWTLPEGEG